MAIEFNNNQPEQREQGDPHQINESHGHGTPDSGPDHRR